ncbi:hypothetical protein MMC31_007527 [Peltigera leucophlebia]|nr:hypothetical protein [Peltigera leucophlebia]
MFSPVRSRPLFLTHQLLKPHSSSFRRLYSIIPSSSENRPKNTTPPPTPVQNVSESNALPTSAAGAQDAPLQESAEEGEIQRQLQAPNRAGVWSRSQQPREKAMVGPRFEQTIMQHQAYEHHKEHLHSLPSTPYPLEPLRDIAEIVEPQRVTDEPFAQR